MLFFRKLLLIFFCYLSEVESELPEKARTHTRAPKKKIKWLYASGFFFLVFITFLYYSPPKGKKEVRRL